METIGYICSALIGISLGLMGAGGSILTLPVLVYFFGIDPLLGVRYSLFIIGSTSIAAILPRIKKGEVLFLQGGVFGLISIIVVWSTRTFLMPVIPEKMVWWGYNIRFSAISMVAFSLIMMLASKAMITTALTKNSKRVDTTSEWKMILAAVTTGLLTGMLGAGGGFLIVPTLILIFRIEMKKAIGTSLLVISMNAVVGFLSEMNYTNFDWNLIILITIIALLGSFVGQRISSIIDTVRLRKSFGWFIFIMAIVILTGQTIQALHQKKTIVQVATKKHENRTTL